MKRQREGSLYTEAITMLAPILLILAGCFLVGLMQIGPAWAGEIQTVKGDEIQPCNGFLISLAPETEASEPIVLESSPNVTKEAIHLEGRDTPDIRLTFNDLDSEGETGFVVVKHPVVGHLQAPNGDEIQVGATVRYEVTYSRAPEGTQLKDTAYMEIHACMGLAVGQFNISRAHATYSFFDTQNGEPVHFETGSLYYSISSLNGKPLAEYIELAENSFEKVLYKQDGNIAVTTRGKNTVLYGEGNRPDDPGWNGNCDSFGSPYYNNNTVMVYPKNGIIDFWVGDDAEGCASMCWQISSSPIAHAPLQPPTKTVTNENAHEGEKISYSVVQEMGKYGIGDIIPYKSFSFVDHLPDGVAYTQGSARMIFEGEELIDITDSAGQAAYDPATHTLTYTFNADYLQNMPLVGQLYRLTFDCVVAESSMGSSNLSNTASTYLNGYELKSDKVDTLVNNAALSIEKKVSKEQWKVGDIVDYRVTVSNTADNSVADNVVVSDISLPEGLAVVDTADIEVQGVEDSVSHPVLVDGTITMQDKSNAYNLKPEGTGWNLYIDYLGSDTPVTIIYHAKATADVAQKKVVNTATAVADNAQAVQDSAHVLILDDRPHKQGYEVTAYKSADPASGSVVGPGSTITYTLEARNTGSEPAAYTFLRDYIPEGTTYVEGSVNRNGCYVAQGNYVEWVIENIGVDDAQKVAYQVTVNDDPPALIANVALYGSAETSPGKTGSISADPPNKTNEVMHSTDKDITVPALLDLEKTSDPKPGSTVLAGSTIRYTLVLSNNGGQDATRPCIRDYIPQGTTYVDGSATESGVFDANNNCLTWTLKQLGAGDSLEVSFSVAVQEDSLLNIISNHALFQNNWDGTEDPLDSSNIVAHRFGSTPSTSEATPDTPSGPQGSIAKGMAKTGDFIMKNIIAILCAMASIAAIALWRKRVETKKTGYTRYGRMN